MRDAHLVRNKNVKSIRITKLCEKILVVSHIIIKQTEGTLILFSRCSLSFLLLTLSWQRTVKVKWRVINNMYVVRRLDD